MYGCFAAQVLNSHPCYRHRGEWIIIMQVLISKTSLVFYPESVAHPDFLFSHHVYKLQKEGVE